MEWITKWKLDRVTLNPVEVRVTMVSDSYCLVEGDEHTSYKGNYFNSPADAFAAAYAECERSMRREKQRKEDLDRARERYEKRVAEGRPS